MKFRPCDRAPGLSPNWPILDSNFKRPRPKSPTASRAEQTIEGILSNFDLLITFAVLAVCYFVHFLSQIKNSYLVSSVDILECDMYIYVF